MLDPVDLDSRVTEVSARALAFGALEPIPTRAETIPDGAIAYQVRVLRRQLERKRRAREERPPGHNPFLPPDPDLLVGEISPTHLCVLNKFNVIERHLLLVTREFEDQASPLTPADFDALARCLAGIDGLAFYNAGIVSGASQPHRHLQLVPPLAAPLRAPIEAAMREPLAGRSPVAPSVATISDFRFAHAILRLPRGRWTPPAAGRALHAGYRSLLEHLGHAPTAPYNLLATRDWMLLVPRSRERFGTISVNGLGFAGSFFVRDHAELASLRAAGPGAALAAVVTT